MDPIKNPFTPGAGSPPPELAGRDEIRQTVAIELERARQGRSAKNILLIGLRGVGKTVLLDTMRLKAEAQEIITLRIEAPEHKSLPALLAPQLRQAMLKLSMNHKAKEYAKQALRALAGFAKAMKLKYSDIEVGLDYDPEPGLADNGDLEPDLPALMEMVAQAAKHAQTALGIFIDELQYVRSDELGSLITALHRCSQQSLPVVLIGAGLPQLRALVGKAKTYAERLFEFPFVTRLSDEECRSALRKPIEHEGAAIGDDALEQLVRKTQGYPYFVQEWGKHVWNAAPHSPIEAQDVEHASALSIASLDDNFFRVRFDRLSPSERRYLRAMAELGEGPHRSGDIASALKQRVTALAPIRNQLIAKGMIWSPGHGDTAFTVPLFHEFMKRIMPKDDWRPLAVS